MEQYIKEHQRTTNPFTADEIQDIFSAIYDQEENDEEYQKAIEVKIEELKKEKERFARVLMTEGGSVYFIFESGKSLRIKKVNQGWEVQGIFGKIVFLTVEEAGRVRELLKKESGMNGMGILDKEIEIDSPTIGGVPFEFGIDTYPKIAYKEKDNKLIVHGDNNNSFCSGYHFGHRITEIIK